METPRLALLNPQSIGSFLKLEWWIAAAKSAARFAPKCIASAALLTVVNIVVVITMSVVEKKMQIPQSDVSLEQLQELTIALVLGMLVTLLSLVLSILALALWGMRLTAYAKLIADPRASVSPNETDAAIKEVAGKKWNLCKVWSVASLIMLIPVLPLVALITLQILSSPSMTQAMPQNMLPELHFVDNYRGLIVVLQAFCGVITLAYTFLVISYSALSDDSAATIAWVAAKKLAAHFVPVVGMASVLAFLNVAISAPYLLVGAGDFVGNNVALSCLSQVWLGLTSVILWPLSITPFCRTIGAVPCTASEVSAQNDL